jgi:UDP-glucose 4-epimerase
MAERTIVVTGVAGYWGGRVARRLLAEPGAQVIGIDVKEPAEYVSGLDFVAADLRSSLLAEFLQAAGVDTVCHLKFKEATTNSDATYQHNVTATKALLAACVEAGVSHVVLKSSTTVYGANPSNSAFLPESHALRGGRRYAYNRHLVEIEQASQAFAAETAQPTLTVLRFASIVGPTADTPMTRLLRGRFSPTLLGFDPMMQVIHEDDVVEALAYAALNQVAGVFNVAAEGALPLTRMLGLTRTAPLPVFHPLAYWGMEKAKEPADLLPIEPDYLRYRWVADLTKMREELGFYPQKMADEAVRSLQQQQEEGQPAAEAADDSRLREAIEARREA